MQPELSDNCSVHGSESEADTCVAPLTIETISQEYTGLFEEHEDLINQHQNPRLDAFFNSCVATAVCFRRLQWKDREYALQSLHGINLNAQNLYFVGCLSQVLQIQNRKIDEKLLKLMIWDLWDMFADKECFLTLQIIEKYYNTPNQVIIALFHFRVGADSFKMLFSSDQSSRICLKHIKFHGTD
jgi:hypothetical protein